jgi:adenylate kinase family enzyme
VGVADRQLVQGERWILDGNYGGTMEIRLAAADSIVFLDPPPLLCIWRVLRRRKRDKPASTLRLLRFVAYIWRYRRTRRPAVQDRIARHRAGKQVHVLHSRRDVEQFLALVA